MKNSIYLVLITVLSLKNGYGQTKENMPIKPENIKFYRSNVLISDSSCDCRKTDLKDPVIVKIKVTTDMFRYDMIQVGARYYGNNEKTVDGEYRDKIQIIKSEFKNKYSVGSEISFQLSHSTFCNVYAGEKSTFKRYLVELLGANITRYDEYYDNGYRQYIKYPVYGEYDYLARSIPFKYMVNTKEAEEKTKEAESERKKNNRKEKRTKVISTVAGAALLGYLAYVIYGNYNPK